MGDLAQIQTTRLLVQRATPKSAVPSVP